MRTLLLCGLMLAAMPATVFASESPSGPSSALLQPSEWRRFTASAVPLLSADGKTAVLYDFATRCAFIANGETMYWRAPPATGEPFGVGHTVNQGHGDLQLALTSSDTDAGDCSARAATAYGTHFETGASTFGGIARHSIAVLQGGVIDGDDATASKQDIEMAKAARERAASRIKKPLLLGFRQQDDRVILIIGEPAGTARWFTQYRSTANGWLFEGAYDAPYLD